MRRSEIEFQAGAILRKEMLQDLYEYPRIAIESLYSDYSDGILYGLLWKEREDNHHIICPGALKLNGNIYFMREELDVEKELAGELSVNGSYRLCFVCQKAERKIEAKTDYVLKLAALHDREYKEVEANAFWYAYIKYSGGKKIEIVTDDTGYATIKFGVPGLISADDGFRFQLPNWLMKQHILVELEGKFNKHPLDYLLLREIYAGKAISISLINVYLNELGEEKIDIDCSPNMVMEKLSQAIKELSFKVSNNLPEEENTDITEEPWRGGMI